MSIREMEKNLLAVLNDTDFEHIELALNDTNIFKALSIVRAEIRHSSFLAFLLDPSQSHGLDDKFLKKVLRDIFLSEKVSTRTSFDVDYMGTNNAKIYKEWKNIDILIELDDDVIVIENKVDAKDSKNQLKLYRTRVNNSFPDKNKHFIYLTPFGEDPLDASESEYYTNYSYEAITSILEAIITISGDRVTPKYRYLIQDYISSVRREVIMNDQLNEMALKLYYAHKEAFDFILENRPDNIQTVNSVIRQKLESLGFKMGSSSKTYVRFSTESSYEVVPRNTPGWKNKELFLFEVVITEKRCVLKAVISPGEDNLVSSLLQELKENKATSHLYKKPQGKQWRVFYSKNINIGVDDISSIQPEDHASEIADTFEKQFNKYKDDVIVICDVIEAFFKARFAKPTY
ncbi:PDDEXK-like family protein [Alteromonas sp. S167]|uniref:PDDEXK-like family protein n=1 Tax=Alteromonas sp. S167 TaxID=3117402 RepID=UPI002FE108B4